MTRQKLLQLGWEALIYLLYSDTAPLDGLFKILLMKKNSIPWKTVKGHWNSSLFKKIKKKKIEEDGIMKLPEKRQKVVEQNGEHAQ